MIKINGRFSIQRYKYGYEVHERYTTTGPDGEDKVSTKVSFCPNLLKSCLRIQDSIETGSKGAKKVKQLIEELRASEERIKKFITQEVKRIADEVKNDE